jgi:predicted small secreted protein
MNGGSRKHCLQCSIQGVERSDAHLITPKARKHRLPKEKVMLNKLTVVRVLALALMTSVMLGVMGCNTMEGAGKDTERAGEKIQDAADRNK